MFVTGCAAPSGPPLEFEEHEIITGAAEHQLVLTGFFTGGVRADLAVVSRDEGEVPQVQIHVFSGDTWRSEVRGKLRAGAQLVDLARIDGRDRLVTYESGRVNWFDPDAELERPLVDLPGEFTGAVDGRIPHVDITRDLNGDGRDDLVMPDLDGFWIALQRESGSFEDAMQVGPPEPFLDGVSFEDERTYGEVGVTALTMPWYLSRIHQLDYDRDGRVDLVFWNGDHFDVHVQDEHGSFAPVATRFTTEVAFDSDGTYSHLFGYEPQSVGALLLGMGEHQRRTVLHSLRDLDGDGVADLLTQTLEGRNLLRQRSWYEVHFGRATCDGIEFAPEAGAAVHPRGRAAGLQASGYSSQTLVDLDGDGRVEIMFRDVNIGVGGMVRAMVANSIALELEFYRVEEGRFAEPAAEVRAVRPDLGIFGGRGPFFPVVLLGDVNGDVRSDLVVGEGWDALYVFLGAPGPELFEREPRPVAAMSPRDERDIWLTDLDRDGKDDIVLHHRFPEQTQRVTVLMAP